MKSAWFLRSDDCNEGVAVVAESLKEAKGIEEGGQLLDVRLPGCVITGFEIYGAAIADLEKGHIVEWIDGLRRGCYSEVDGNCPVCGKHGRLTLDNEVNRICCVDCEEKLLDTMLAEEE